MKPIKLIFLIAFFLALSIPASAMAEGSLSSNGLPIELDADFITYEKETETYYARGSVELRQEGVSIRTDELILNTASGVATARAR